MHRRLAPPCVAPECRDQGWMPRVADEHGRYAGRDWAAGERIDVCALHYALLAEGAGQVPGATTCGWEWQWADLSPEQPAVLRTRALSAGEAP